MPKGTPVFAPSGFPPEPTAYVLAALDPGFTHDEFTVVVATIKTYLLHQTPGRFSCMVALNGLVLSEGVDYTTNYDSGEITIVGTLHVGDKIEARYAVTAVATSTNVRVTDTANQSPTTITDTASAPRQTPIGISAVDTVSQSPHTIADAHLVQFGNTIKNGVDADDGWVSSVPTYTNAGATISVGNTAGVIDQAFVRFVLPYNIAGTTIAYAALQFVPDANLAIAANIRVRADKSGTAAAPTSKADFDGRLLTTAFTDVSLTATTGVKLPDIDVTAVVQEVAAAGATTALVFELLDNASPASSLLQLRSFAHSTGPFPTLVLAYA